MRNIKTIALHVGLITLASLTAKPKPCKHQETFLEKDPSGLLQPALRELGLRFENTLEKHMPAAQLLSAVLGQKFGAEFLSSPVAQLAVTNAGQGFGENFGVGALKTIGSGLTVVRSDIISLATMTQESAVAGAAAAKAATLSAAATVTPVLPYIAVGAAVAGTGYVGYRVYRAYNPTDEDRLVAIMLKSKLLKAENEREEDHIRLEQTRRQSEQIAAQKTLQTCLAKNRNNPNTGISGRPTVCEEAAYVFAMAAGTTKPLEKITRLHNKLAWE